MGSSSGDDYSTPPQQPAPPGNLIQPPGSSVPYQPHYINFLGDTNVPSTGLTPQMLGAINAMNGPAPGAVAPAAAAAAPAPGGGGLTPEMQADLNRQRMALMFMENNPTMQNERRAQMMKDAYGPGAVGGHGGGRWAEGGGYGGGGLGSSNRGGGGLGMRGGGY